MNDLWSLSEDFSSASQVPIYVSLLLSGANRSRGRGEKTNGKTRNMQESLDKHENIFPSILLIFFFLVKSLRRFKLFGLLIFRKRYKILKNISLYSR